VNDALLEMARRMAEATGRGAAMTEAEWLASEDPAAMLEWLLVDDLPGGGGGPSERKLRLWACACWRAHPWGESAVYPSDEAVIRRVEAAADEEVYEPQAGGKRQGTVVIGVGEASRAARTWAQEEELSERPHLPRRAAMLRDIMGNPFRPCPDLPNMRCRRCGLLGKQCGFCGRGWRDSAPWLTPQVLSLAQAAYEERDRECGKCMGDGRYFSTAAAAGKMGGGFGTLPCEWCHGTGRTDDGTLDPFRLALVADALEEAGCDSEPLLLHLRGDVAEYKDDAVAYFHTDTSGPQLTPVHAREAHRHVRGCWALDLILGKE
jgi:hypothetical protein